MEIGWLDVCLTVADVAKSRKFYEDLGFKKVEGNDEEGWAVVVKEESRLGLYEKQHMGESTFTLNFRGGNVHQIKSDLETKGHQFSPDFTPNEDGTGSAIMKDPDGHVIFFDTAPGEIKKT